jgi:hypothetical protein
MIRTLFTAGAVALAVGLSSGLVLADANPGQAPQVPTKPAMYPGYSAPWHYELQYTYGHHGQWHQEWVPVMNEAK